MEKFPQKAEENEYRFIDPIWLDEVAKGLTQGAKDHPTGSWKTIPALEHAARALRHINLFRAGDTTDTHIINATMRLMMAHVVAREEAKAKRG